ncbi:aspartic peptidase domain-containing protein [Kockiozyma suomiensis]|uniref:aspartic peptidase domain-containing protein n=1 Tax=Kockiozyma suomiensis TaxID=1337062 RepID=UPI003343AAE2
MNSLPLWILFLVAVGSQASEPLVSLNLKRAGSLTHSADLDTVSSTIYQYLHAVYLAEISIGSSQQTLYLPIDTNSGDTWVVGSSSSCPPSSTYCSFFNWSLSSTFQDVGQSFSLPSWDNPGTLAASGSYGVDSVIFANATFESFQFGLADQSVSGLGALGLGMIFNEQSSAQYANLPLLLRMNNITKLDSYSVWLNDVHSSSGTVLFGGIDLGKFSGGLLVSDMHPREDGSFVHPNISITRILVRSARTLVELVIMGQNSTNTDLENALVYSVIDTSAVESRLPADILLPLASIFGYSSFSAEYNMYTYDCAGIPSQYLIIIELEGKLSIAIKASQVFYRIGDICVLGIMPTDDYSVLGQSFLRSIYFVLDFENFKVGLASSYQNSDISSIRTLDKSGIPTSLTGLGPPIETAATTSIPSEPYETIPTPATTILGGASGIVVVSSADGRRASEWIAGLTLHGKAMAAFCICIVLLL